MAKLEAAQPQVAAPAPHLLPLLQGALLAKEGKVGVRMGSHGAKR